MKNKRPDLRSSLFHFSWCPRWDFPPHFVRRSALGREPSCWLSFCHFVGKSLPFKSLFSIFRKKIIPVLRLGLCFFRLVPKMGLEPTHLSAYAPQAYVSTIPPPGLILLSFICGTCTPLDIRVSRASLVSRGYGSHSTTWAYFLLVRRTI